MSALIESTECSVPRVFVFNVPPRSSSTGHRAADWPKDHLWAGRLRLVTSSDRSSILLEHTDTGKEGLFARCPIEGKSTVEQVTDSSRYFVLKVSDGHGKSAYLGVAFGKKEEALEFKIALQTATDRNGAEKKAAEYFNSQPAVTALATDASIEVDLSGKFKKKKESAAAAAAASAGPAVTTSGTGGFAIAPPKASEKKSRKAVAQSHHASASAAAPAPTPAPAAPKPAQNSTPAPVAPTKATSLDTDATLLEAFGAAPPPTAAATADPLAFFSSGK